MSPIPGVTTRDTSGIERGSVTFQKALFSDMGRDLMLSDSELFGEN